MHTIYVSEPVHPQVLDAMSAAAQLLLGFGPQAARYEAVADTVDAVLFRRERFPAERIAASPRLKVMARHAAGWHLTPLGEALRHPLPADCPESRNPDPAGPIL